MPETIKRITVSDLNKKMINSMMIRKGRFILHEFEELKFILVNDIDFYDLQQKWLNRKRPFIFNGLTIIISSDIPHGEIYVV